MFQTRVSVTRVTRVGHDIGRPIVAIKHVLLYCTSSQLTRYWWSALSDGHRPVTNADMSSGLCWAASALAHGSSALCEPHLR